MCVLYTMLLMNVIFCEVFSFDILSELNMKLTILLYSYLYYTLCTKILLSRACPIELLRYDFILRSPLFDLSAVHDVAGINPKMLVVVRYIIGNSIYVRNIEYTVVLLHIMLNVPRHCCVFKTKTRPSNIPIILLQLVPPTTTHSRYVRLIYTMTM